MARSIRRPIGWLALVACVAVLVMQLSLAATRVGRVGFFLVGALAGALGGTVQWAVCARSLRFGRFVACSALGAALGWTVLFPLPSEHFFLQTVTCGVIIGTLQWLAFAERSARGALWIAVQAIAFPSALTVFWNSQALHVVHTLGASGLALMTALGGLTYAAITGPSLRALSTRRTNMV